MKADWTPALAEDGRTLHERLIEALRQDIAAGRLASGARMPTQRGLAETLGIAVGTITKAYAEAERLGLLSSRVGRGTFVAGSAAAESGQDAGADGPIDLSMNIGALGPAAARLPEVLARLQRRGDLADAANFAPHAGWEAHRRAAAGWLREHARFVDADWRRLLICNGAQQGMALALDEVCRPGDKILTSAVTFLGLRSVADYRGFGLVGVAMDREGMLPDALDRAAAESGARVLYVQPTLQNPTARTMSAARRAAVAEVARRRDLWIVESDVYGPLAWNAAKSGPEVPISVLAPERSYYASSVSKALAPGLRVGFLMTPDAQRYERACTAMRMACYSISPLAPMLAAQWMQDGTAARILDEMAGEAVARSALAAQLLGPAMETPSFAASLHVWLPMSELEAERVASRALRQGVTVTSPAGVAVPGAGMSGVRLCLNSPPDLATLRRALRVVAGALGDEDGARDRPSRSGV
ncbi:MAG: PLP-dependent aminotransferase family protein [Candidatus Protistobacter heckmanni]|nr:PLP-dependent aminotransferase family protein [Candidatus Protistobacter heckmanni]